MEIKDKEKILQELLKERFGDPTRERYEITEKSKVSS